ncbi:hypothetical protein [Limosilactobacillus fermentum]|uniref:hypothetical protein n=1 Tax=Limosilactobacillus fermentum TaxID=1613 RepID=UPI0020B40CDA|nr:hypothetical protein [Limosilactobacillus fermentum]UTF48245.1 hypothetical protein NHN16_03765 [Limosilactobacillus fermentum]
MYQPTNAKQITSAVAERLDMLKDEGLALPANYNAQNALKAAYLRLQTVKDRQGRPALTVCTEPKHCGKCEYCRSMKELAAFQHVTDIEVD